jgi:hypothetical protein
MKKWRTRDMPPADPEERAAQKAPRPAPPPQKSTSAGAPRTGFMTGPITIYFTVVCDLTYTSTDAKKRGKPPSGPFSKILKTSGAGGGWTRVSPLQLSGDEAEDFLRLVADGDQKALKDRLGELLEMYELNGGTSDWGSVSIRCDVTDIVEFAISE